MYHSDYSKIIAPYDNTGFRSRTGESVNIFYTEKECWEFYNKQCDKIVDKMKEEKIRKQEYFDREIDLVLQNKKQF